MMRSSSALLVSFVWTLLHSSSIPGTHEQHPSSLPVTHFHHTVSTLAFFSSYSSSNKPSSSKPFKKLFTAGRGWGGEASWAVATARLYPIRTRSVEKGCGLEPVTSVPLPSAPTAFCRERQRDGGQGGREYERSTRQPAGCVHDLKQRLVLCMASLSLVCPAAITETHPQPNWDFPLTASEKVLISHLNPIQMTLNLRGLHTLCRKCSAACCVQAQFFLSTVQKAGYCSELRI